MIYLEWQQSLWDTLWESRQRLPHGLLLQGPKGIGKAAFADFFAQALLCESPGPSGLPCARCPSCIWFAAGNHPDFRRVQPEAAEEGEGEIEDKGAKRPSVQITVTQIRELDDFVHLSTHNRGPRIIMINPAEAMNAQAANALLKTLEEPAPRTLFLLVSHQPRRLLPTILSRCRKVPMPVPEPAAAEAWLSGQGVENPKLALAQAGYAPLEAPAMAAGGLQAQRAGFLEALSSSRPEPYALADAMRKAGLEAAVGWLQKWCYDLVAVRLAGIVRYHLDFRDAMLALAPGFDPAQMLRYHRELLWTQRMLNHPLNPGLLSERLALDYCRLFDREKRR